MLSRNKLFRKVSGIAELMDVAHSEWKKIREKLYAEIDMSKGVRDAIQEERKILARLASLRKSLRDMRDNVLFDASVREDAPVADGKKSSHLIVGDRLLDLIREEPKFKPLAKPRKYLDGVLVGSIEKLKVVHYATRYTAKPGKKRKHVA